jgi:acetyl/propionyl-CoA carboxylase alpha subunit
MVDEAYCLGNGTVSETYLNIELIIRLAKQARVDAIHPGYGFLSENYLFAQACEENNIAFIGPSSAILKLMGDKLTAHAFAAKLGVPVLEKLYESADEIGRQRENLTYPLLVKAAAGGGGKGMRLVNSSLELTDVLESAASEALKYFSDDRVFIERYLHAPRHIEVQLMGDMYGTIVHLFERECSIQRRHQKIIEEAPAVILTSGQREKMTGAALAIARAAGYYNAGTIEFLLDDTGEFYFLEMNPRIQVEHGVTEMVTGIDLVKEQVLVAQGYPLSFSAETIIPAGHAIEARIYAEDPENELMPYPGTVHYYCPPLMEGVRVETAIQSGASIQADYDPLIAKVIVHETTRNHAIESMRKALENFVITGVHHNIPLVMSLLNDRSYIRNAISTSFCHARMPAYVGAYSITRQNTEPTSLLIAAALITGLLKSKTDASDVWNMIGYWRIFPRLQFLINGKQWEIELIRAGGSHATVYMEGVQEDIQGILIDDCQLQFTRNGKFYHMHHIPESGGIIEITSLGLWHRVERTDRLTSSGPPVPENEDTPGENTIRSPLHGKITRVNVSPEEQVSKGECLLTIESMKLENNILAPFSGIVKQIDIREGDRVKPQSPLLLLQSLNN